MQLCLIKRSFLKYLAQTSPTPPMYEFVDSEGVYLIDKDKNRYIDLISGIAVNNIGHQNKKVVKAVRKQAGKFMHQMVYGEYIIAPQVRLAKSLTAQLPKELDNCYFLNSGSEAVEAALKLGKKYTGRRKIVAIRGAYHGSTSGALSLMSNEHYSAPFKPLLPEVYFVDFNDTDSLSVIDADTAIVISEVIQAESGYIPAQAEFLDALRKRCTDTGALLAFDEIQSGIGRTGRLFAFEHYGVVPDILLSAKALGAGMPLSAVITSQQFMKCLSHDPILGHITTFGGHPVSCAAAHAGLKFLLKEGLMNEVAAKEERFRQNLTHPLIQDISGKGLMLSIELGSFDLVEHVMKHCFEHGVIIDWFLYRSTSLRISPPLIISDEQIAEVCSVIHNALDAWS